jgi:putative ABC transport system permease protein
MTFQNTLRSALRGIAANKLRAALTTLGIVIGVASVIVMLALGNGARAAVDANFRFLGSDQVQIYEKKAFEDGKIQPIGERLSYEDGLLLKDAVPQVDQVDMSVSGSGKVRHGRAVLDMNFAGVTNDSLATHVTNGEVQPVNWPEGTPLTLDAFLGQGRIFTPSEVLAGANVCLLGYQTALDLFAGEDPIDQTIWVSRKPCLVVGVLAELEFTDPAQRYQSDPNEGLYMPISTAIQNFFTEEPSVNIVAHVKDEARMDETKQQIKTYLRQRHNIQPNAEEEYDDDFEMMSRSDVLGAQQQAAQTFSLLLAAMAVVSLVVGGIGIMNVMLVSVSERTREIGIRMAIGARREDIIFQFLAEAILISMAGGLFGIITGVITIPVAAGLNQGIALLAADSIPLAFGVAMLTGVVFGLYPALRASNLSPIDALRYE